MATRMVWHGQKILKRIEKQSTNITECLAKTVESNARRIVTVKTGALKNTIQAEGNIVSAGSDEVDYAGKVELGTAKQAAKPFLRPASEQLTKSDVDKCIT